MKNPFSFLRTAEWNVLEVLAENNYSDFGQCTKSFIAHLRGTNHGGPSTVNRSNAFTVCKLLVDKGLVTTNIGEDQTYDDVVFLTERGLKLVKYGKLVEKNIGEIMKIEPTQVKID
jgi:DNA-binding MarR family transcriptional regulator